MDTSADTAIAHTLTITSTTVMSVTMGKQINTRLVARVVSMEYQANTTAQRRYSMCECELDNDYLTLCDEHKQELENLKNNPPLWAIRARRGK